MLTKVHLVKAMVFPVVMYGCESWTIKKAEHWWIDAFEMWCWRRLLSALWTARRSNQSILNEINSECSLGGLMLKLQYFGHLMQRTDSLEKTLMLERLMVKGEGDDRGWDGWIASPHGLQSTRLLCPWDFPGKDTGVGCHILLQGIFPTQGLNPGLLHCRQILYWLSYKRSPKLHEGRAISSLDFNKSQSSWHLFL